jgi:hypothetical protein
MITQWTVPSMQIYIFVSDLHSSIRAFTSDATGGNLPTEYAPWHAVNGGRAMAIGSDRDPLARAVAQDGFFLVTTREHAPPPRYQTGNGKRNPDK